MTEHSAHDGAAEPVAVPPAVVERVARLIASSVLPGTVVAINAPASLEGALDVHGFTTHSSTSPSGSDDDIDDPVAVALFLDDGRGTGLETTLAEIGEAPLLVVAVPNEISFTELAARFDASSNPVTRDPLTAAVTSAGYELSVVADAERSDDGDPPTVARALLAELARRAGHDPDVGHLVRSFRPTAGASDRVSLSRQPPEPSCFLSVIVRTQGRRSTLVDTLTSLAAQRDGDLEVLVMAHEVSDDDFHRIEGLVASFARAFADRVRVSRVAGGGRSAPLNAALDLATGAYVAILDDDDVVTSEWVAVFRRAAARRPGRVVRARCAVQAIERRTGGLIDFEPVSGLDTPYPTGFDLLDTIRSNRSPPCGYAIPKRLVDALTLRFDDTLRVCEDWKLQLDAARIVGVSDDPAVTSVYRRWVGDGGSAGVASEAVWIEDHYRVVDDLDGEHTIVPPGSLRRIHELYERIEQLEVELGRRAPDDRPARFGPDPDARSG